MKNIDKTDRDILQILERDARISLTDLGKHICLSGPAIRDRLRALQHAGVITHYSAQIDLRSLGYTIQALVRIKPRSGQLHPVEQMLADQPRFMSCDSVTGEDCYVARLALRDIAELDDILLPLHDHAETHTSIVKSTIFENRLPPLAG